MIECGAWPAASGYYWHCARGRGKGLPTVKPRDEILLRVFIGEEERHEGRPLYASIVAKALAAKIGGATVLPGPGGFGPSRHMRSSLYVDAGPRRPVVVEIVDAEERINGFLGIINDMVTSGLVTLERVRSIHYGRTRRGNAA